MAPNECAYCDRASPETRDHLPPKGFFPSPRPSNLITVPCCESCRLGQSKDDETVRLILSVHRKAGRHPAMERLAPTKVLGRLRSWRYAKYFLGLIRPGIAETPTGLIVPAHDIAIELEPMTGFMTRLTRGMHFHHTGQRLPADWTVYLVVEPMFAMPVVAEILTKLRGERAIDIGGGVFSYKFVIRRGRTTTWLFKFYDGVEFMTVASSPAAARSRGAPEDDPPAARDWIRSSLV